MPKRIFETGTAWRRIQRSGVAGIHSGRAYTLIDYHAFAIDTEQMFDEWRHLLLAQAEALTRLGQAETLLMLEIEQPFFKANLSPGFSPAATVLPVFERAERL